MNMTVNQLSSTQYEVTLSWTSMSLVFTIIKNETNRTASISFNRITGTSGITSDVPCKIVCNDSDGRLMQILNTTYSASQIRNGVVLSAPSYPANYLTSGYLDLLLTITFSPYVSEYLDFSSISAIFNIGEQYTVPSVQISSVSGVSRYGNTSYVNLNDTINFQISANSEYNTCDPLKSYIGIEYRRTGFPNKIIRYDSIGDDSAYKSITINQVPDSNFEAYDRADIFIHVIREDNRGATATDSYYLGYLYTLPRVINPKIEVYSTENSTLKYDLTNYYGTCILLTNYNSIQFKLSYDAIVGDVGSFLMSVVHNDQVLVNGRLPASKADLFVTTTAISNLKIDKSEDYIISFIPVSSKDYANENQKVVSRVFKLLKYMEYSFAGIDDNPLYPDKAAFTPIDTFIKYAVLTDTATVNANSEMTATKVTNINPQEIHTSVQSCYSRPVVLRYSELNHRLDDVIVYLTFDGYSMAHPWYTVTPLSGNSYGSILSRFGISNDENNSFFLMNELVVTIDGVQHSFYQYIARLCYVPEVYEDIPITMRSNNYSIRVNVNVANAYGNHQNGIISKYELKMMYGSQLIYEGTSSTNEFSFAIPEQVVSGRYYTFIVNLLYTEDVINNYQYTNNRINFKSRVDKQEITDVPDILYPTTNDDDPYCCYSYYAHPFFLMFIQLPKVLPGTSGTPEPGDNVYSDIKVVINGVERLYSNYSDLFIGEPKYLGRTIFVVDTEVLGITAAEQYNIKVYVKQNYGGINAYGDYAEINVSGMIIKAGERRIEEDYNGFVTYDLYRTAYTIMAGFCKSYAAYNSSEDASSIIDKYKKGVGEVIYAEDFNEVSRCVKSTIRDVNLWLTEVETSKTKILEDGIVFEAVPATIIQSDVSYNYIEQMYDWVQYMYDQIEYEPEENFITFNHSDNTTCTIVMYIGNNKSVRIPPTIRSRTVTKIDQIAFSGNQTLEKVILPNTCTTVLPDLQYDSSNFIVSGDTYIRYMGHSQSVLVPATYNGVTMHTLDVTCFQGTPVTDVVISNGITTIN